ncbi:MAG: TRAFs-binding domain-containing protein, partial [Desulfococcaceae bacterium]
MKYQPAPIDIAGISLDESLQELSEKLAENAHEVWADLRVRDGWTFGPKRDDEHKRHPCLVPFSQLPESEQKYDREMVTQVLKSMVALGYRIVPPDRPLPDAAPEYLQEIGRRLEDSKPLPLRDLQRVWERHVAAEWKQAPKIYKMLGERIIKVGEPLMAYDVLSQGMACFPEKADPDLLNPEDRALWARMMQLTGLALVQSGAIHSARKVLRKLERKGFRDGETLGLLARTYKEIGFARSSGQESRTQLAIAHAHYLEAFENARKSGDLAGAFYTGINAATLALACGEAQKSRALARTVQDVCHAFLTENPERVDRDYWVRATLGEASLLLEEMESAGEFYRKASEMAKGNFRDISAMRKQAGLALRLLDREAEPIRSWFPVPRVWILFGEEAEASFSKRLSKEIDGIDEEGIAFAALARPADLAAAEAVLRRNLELNVVLPVSRTEILALWEAEKRTSENLGNRLHAVLKDASKVFELSSHCDHGNECNIQFAIHFLHGMARLRARWLDTEVSVFPPDRGSNPPETIPIPADWVQNPLAN